MSILWGCEGTFGTSSGITTMDAELGKKMPLASFGFGFTSGTPANIVSKCNAVHGQDRIPILDWFGPDRNRDVYQSRLYDAYLDSVANAVKGLQYPVMFRFDGEHNGTWRGYCEGNPGNLGYGSGDFVAMWQYVVNRMRSRGASNIAWIWCPNICKPLGPTGTGRALHETYPGDDYVDWIALDGYNFGGQTSSPWMTFTQVFRGFPGSLRDTWAEACALGSGTKPLMLGEHGCDDRLQNGTQDGNAKADWITDAWTVQIPGAFSSRLKAVMYFNVDVGDGHWAFSEPGSGAGAGAPLAAIRAALTSSYYLAADGLARTPANMTPLQPYTTSAPVVTVNPASITVGATSIAFSASTNVPGTIQAKYVASRTAPASDAGYTSSTAAADATPMRTSHSVALSGLLIGTTYQIKAFSTDSWGNVG